eukprot:gb/GECH01014318.1/.p1 GENE.gb/GECH01014318.1/~~gb/GECH01014318.1/.p1  ORF type:complete len:111 (+),score=6.21 gb/GECH01014318.1/:1-333(+)
MFVDDQPSRNYECHLEPDNEVEAPAVSDSVIVELLYISKMTLSPIGVTVLCSDVDNGFVYELNRVEYTKRSQLEINQMIREGNYTALENTCTSSTTNMEKMFYEKKSIQQ